MRTLTTFLIVMAACLGTQTFAQEAQDNASAEAIQLEEEILRVRNQLMQLERERKIETVSSDVGGVITEPSSLRMTGTGNEVVDGSLGVDAVPAPLATEVYSTAPYQQSIPLTSSFPSSTTLLDQSLPTQVMWYPTDPMVVAQPAQLAQTVYAAAPATEYSQPAAVAMPLEAPAPMVQQPVIIQQAPAPQAAPTIIVNIYQQAPAARNNYVPPIMAPIYGPAPVQFSAPRRGCCLFGRY